MKEWTAEAAEELRKYERTQWLKALLAGSDKAWKQYETNIKRRVNKINKEYDVTVDADLVMNMY